MPKIAATLITSVTGSVVTTDGSHMVLQVRTADGGEIALGVPRKQFAQLIDHCAFSNAQCERILRSGHELKETVTWWNSALDRSSRELSLTLTFGKGGTLSFGFTEHMAKVLLASLRATFNESAVGQESKSATNIRHSQAAS